MYFNRAAIYNKVKDREMLTKDRYIWVIHARLDMAWGSPIQVAMHLCVYVSNSLSIYVSNSLPIYVCIYLNLSMHLSNSLSIYVSI
jgi:hypothetical protein